MPLCRRILSDAFKPMTIKRPQKRKGLRLPRWVLVSSTTASLATWQSHKLYIRLLRAMLYSSRPLFARFELCFKHFPLLSSYDRFKSVVKILPYDNLKFILILVGTSTIRSFKTFLTFFKFFDRKLGLKDYINDT